MVKYIHIGIMILMHGKLMCNKQSLKTTLAFVAKLGAVVSF